jgi:predicted nucleic acid-binding Zn ribbon protein
MLLGKTTVPDYSDDDSDLDPEGPDKADMDADVDDNTIPCPHCKRAIHEESDFCPHCGQYITAEDAPMNKPIWIVVAVIACLLIVMLWLAARG